MVSSGTTSKQISSEKDAQKIGYGGMITEAILATIALVCVAFGLKNIPEGKTPVEIFALGFGRIVFFLGDYAHFAWRYYLASAETDGGIVLWDSVIVYSYTT